MDGERLWKGYFIFNIKCVNHIHIVKLMMLGHQENLVICFQSTEYTWMIKLAKYFNRTELKNFIYIFYSPYIWSHPSSTCRSTEISQFNLHTIYNTTNDRPPAPRNPSRVAHHLHPSRRREECSASYQTGAVHTIHQTNIFCIDSRPSSTSSATVAAEQSARAEHK